MSDPTPAPGWYPAPHANNEQRYWDGVQWLDNEPAPPSVPGSDASTLTPSRGLAIAALAVGIVGFLTGLLPVVGALIGVAAIILGIIALTKKQSKGMAIIGLVLGVIALITSLAMTAGVANLAGNTSPSPAVDSPSSEPTSSAAAEPEPSAEPEEPEQPAAPLVARQEFTGTGDMVLDLSITESAIISFSCGDCTSNTVVKTNGSDSLLVNTIGAYSGAHLVNVEVGSMITQVVVEATGSWSLVVDDVTTAPRFEAAATGTGDSVIILTGSFNAAAITNDAGSNFVIRAYGDGNYSPLIVNEIGAYSGTVEMSAPAVVQVISEGNWSITGQ